MGKRVGRSIATGLGVGVLLLVVVGGAGAGEPVAAKVGDTQIGVDEVVVQQAKFPGRSRRQVLDLLIARELLRLEGQSQGLGKDPQLAAELAQYEFQTLLQLIQDREAGAVQISEGEVEQLYREWGSGEEVRASHILCTTEEEAKAVLAQLQGGASFVELAKEHSVHKLSSLVGGEMGYMRKDLLMPEFREQVWAMKTGEIYPQPLKTRLGFHVVKLTDHHKLAVDSLRSTLQDELRQRRHQNLRATLGAALRDTLDFGWQSQVALQLIGREKATATAVDSATTIAGWRGGSLSVAEYLKRSRIYGVRNSLADTAQARKAGEQLTLDDVLVAAARYRHYNRESGVRRKLRAKQSEIYAQELYARQAGAQEVPSDSLLRAFYGQHREFFQLPPGVKVREILVDDPRLADSLRAQILAGADMGTLASQYTRRRWARGTAGELGVLTLQTPGYGDLIPQAFAAEPGKLQGPLQQGGFFALYLVEERVPPRQATFEEAKSGVVERLQEEAMDRYISQLRVKYARKIRVDEQALGE